MKKYLLLFFVFISFLVYPQITLRITQIPINTPANADIYLAGSINNWNPFSAPFKMIPDGLGAYTLILPEGTGTIEFKFTRGSWTSVEGNANGSYLPNRSVTFTGSPQTINLIIQSWEDISGSGSNSTAASNVQVLSTNFLMPQLNRQRRIWLYLPPDYYTTNKSYPVLYMQDGQNLFDNITSFSGEWQIDETLNALHSQGDYGAIVVGIDNGGVNRINEYSPWVNSQYGGGEGAAYMDFLSNTLKPYIDLNFRTQPQASSTALIGSSLGALIATYGSLRYNNKFEKIGNLSPAYWFVLTDLNNYILNTSNNLSNHRMYFVCGQNESANIVAEMNLVKNNLISKGVLSSNTYTKVDPNGIHNESFWRQEFGALYQWLFANNNLQNIEQNFETIKIDSTIDGKLTISGIQQKECFNLYNVIGKKVATLVLGNGEFSLDPSLPNGVYILKATKINLEPKKLIINR